MSKKIEEFINGAIQNVGVDMNLISDGYHTFGGLYEHRIALWIAYCKLYQRDFRQYSHVWKSRFHSDDSAIEGWFVLGIGKAAGDQMTYHLPMSYWDECEFAETLTRAPEFDGHTSADVLERLRSL